MKARYAEWVKRSVAGKRESVQPPIRILDLPGIQKLEDKLLFNGFPRCNLSPETEKLADSISTQLFDLPLIPEGFEIYDFLEEDDEYDEEPDEVRLSDEDKVEALLALGLDFRDQRGNPLLCTRLLSKQAEAAAQGLAGKLPDRDSANLNRWETDMQRDAVAFKEKKTKNRTNG